MTFLHINPHLTCSIHLAKECKLLLRKFLNSAWSSPWQIRQVSSVNCRSDHSVFIKAYHSHKSKIRGVPGHYLGEFYPKQIPSQSKSDYTILAGHNHWGEPVLQISNWWRHCNNKAWSRESNAFLISNNAAETTFPQHDSLVNVTVSAKTLHVNIFYIALQKGM